MLLHWSHRDDDNNGSDDKSLLPSSFPPPSSAKTTMLMSLASLVAAVFPAQRVCVSVCAMATTGLHPFLHGPRAIVQGNQEKGDLQVGGGV